MKKLMVTLVVSALFLAPLLAACPAAPPEVVPEVITEVNETVCYRTAYQNFLKYPGSVLIYGKHPNGIAHAWIEHEGGTIDGGMLFNGIPTNYIVVLRCYTAAEWEWIMGKWEAGVGIGAVNDDSGVWWISGDGDRFPRTGVEERRAQ